MVLVPLRRSAISIRSSRPGRVREEVRARGPKKKLLMTKSPAFNREKKVVADSGGDTVEGLFVWVSGGVLTVHCVVMK